MIPSLHRLLSREHADLLMKTAEGPDVKRVAKTMGSGLAGMGLGYLTGVGGMALADKLHERVHGQPIPSSTLIRAVPVLGAGAGLAYSLYKAHEMEEMKRALESSDHQSNGPA